MNNECSVPFDYLIKDEKEVNVKGMYSVCSANQYVLKASMLQAKNDNSPLIIESTSNQVNQFGGYMNLTPEEFVSYVKNTADKMKIPFDSIILGGDHLGPNAWQDEMAEKALKKSRQLVSDYVKSGYQKIHLDTSMRCADDPGDYESPLPDEIIAKRAAELCQSTEQSFQNSSNDEPPLYVIGTEVPVAGGVTEAEDKVEITKRKDARRTIELTREAFIECGLENAWERVIALVVQPGVEFGDEMIFDYRRSQKTKELTEFIDQYPRLVFEAHSTDYQTEESLKKMVDDKFAFLKVGPALTFAFREAVFALEIIEKEWLEGKSGVELSNLQSSLDEVMVENPEHWQSYYHGDEEYLDFARKYSFSDRCRYYWVHPRVDAALQKLINNLSQSPIPLSLLSQFRPNQFRAVREGSLNNKPDDIILHSIMDVLKVYSKACINPSS